MKRDSKISVLLSGACLVFAACAFGATPVLECDRLGFTNIFSYGQMPSDDSFNLRNASGAPVQIMPFSITKNVSWLSVVPVEGTVQGDWRRIDLSYDISALCAGVHTGVVTVTSAGADNSPERVWVYMRINARPGLATDATGFTNEIVEGEKVPSDSFDVWNASGKPYATMAYSISCSDSWFSTTVTNATNQGELDRVEIVYDASSLLPGTHTGMVTITARDQATGIAATNSPVHIPVELVIKGTPQLEVSPGSLVNQSIESLSATSQLFRIWNSATTESGDMLYTISESISWLNLSSYSGTIVQGDTNTIVVTYNTSGLSTGVYAGVITVSATDETGVRPAHDSPKQIHVTMRVISRRPVNLQPPYLKGLPKIGSELYVDKGLWTPLDYISFTYQWQRADSLNGFGLVDIPGATSPSYTVTVDDRGKYLRARVTGTDTRAPPPMTTIAFSEFSNQFRINAVKGDFTGDGRADKWFYDMPEGRFRILSSGGRALALQFGWNETQAVAGDFDGDGICDLAIYHRFSGMWYIRTSLGQFIMRQFGWADAYPVPGDYDGDGITDIGVYYPAEGMWFILLSSTGEFVTQQFGWHETVPVPADYDGDGKTDIAVYYQPAGMWYILKSSTGEFIARQFGWHETVPVPGDYNGSGADDLAVYHQAANTWYHIPVDGHVYSVIEPFGTSAGRGIPVPGYYDGDALMDPATVHFNGDFIVWCLQTTSEGYKGYSYQISAKRWR